MGVLIPVLGVLTIIFIGKFIYDSYLTDNTEKRWEEFKQSDPTIANKIENSTFGMKPTLNTFKIRIGGYYVFRFDGNKDTNEKIKMTSILFFYGRKYVSRLDLSGHSEIDSDEVVKYIDETKAGIQNELIDGKEVYNSFITRRKNLSNGEFVLKFPLNENEKYPEDPISYDEFKVKVFEDYLVLDHSSRFYSYVENKFVKRMVFKNKRYDYVKL